MLCSLTVIEALSMFIVFEIVYIYEIAYVHETISTYKNLSDGKTWRIAQSLETMVLRGHIPPRTTNQILLTAGQVFVWTLASYNIKWFITLVNLDHFGID
mgnify:CR=1 FL=1